MPRSKAFTNAELVCVASHVYRAGAQARRRKGEAGFKREAALLNKRALEGALHNLKQTRARCIATDPANAEKFPVERTNVSSVWKAVKTAAQKAAPSGDTGNNSNAAENHVNHREAEDHRDEAGLLAAMVSDQRAAAAAREAESIDLAEREKTDVELLAASYEVAVAACSAACSIFPNVMPVDQLRKAALNGDTTLHAGPSLGVAAMTVDTGRGVRPQLAAPDAAGAVEFGREDATNLDPEAVAPTTPVVRIMRHGPLSQNVSAKRRGAYRVMNAAKRRELELRCKQTQVLASACSKLSPSGMLRRKQFLAMAALLAPESASLYDDAVKVADDLFFEEGENEEEEPYSRMATRMEAMAVEMEERSDMSE